LALVATVCVTPVLIFAVDALFSNANNYIVIMYGKIQVMASLGEIAWACVSHVLLLDFIQASSMPARIILVGFGFLIFTVTNTYTASLVAVLTTESALHEIDTGDLVRYSIATSPTYADRIANRTGADVLWTYDSLPYMSLIHRVRAQTVGAIAFDDVQLRYLAASTDSGCTLSVTPIKSLPFDIGFAYRRGFEYPAMIDAMDDALLALQQQGVYERTKRAHSPPERSCADAQANVAPQVQLKALRGLWVVLGVGCMLSVAVGSATYASSDRDRSRAIDDRARALFGVARTTAFDRQSVTPVEATHRGCEVDARSIPVDTSNHAHVANAGVSITHIRNAIERVESLHQKIQTALADGDDIVPVMTSKSMVHDEAKIASEPPGATVRSPHRRVRESRVTGAQL
jgi:hypothetical protein